MDARSIAATALNGGALTSATDLPDPPETRLENDYVFESSPYDHRVYRGVGRPDPRAELVFGPNIADWPEQIALPESLLISVASAIYDPVTTTDELIPSGETSSLRSNPLRLSEFALSRKDPDYVGRAKAVQTLEKERRAALKGAPVSEALAAFLAGRDYKTCGIGSAVFALKPGDGSAREQAASCQRVLGGVANLVGDFATKRYRSNVINWGMLPFVLENAADLGVSVNDLLYVPGVRAAVENGEESLSAELIQGGRVTPVTLHLGSLTGEERDILLAGCLINHYRA